MMIMAMSIEPMSANLSPARFPGISAGSLELACFKTNSDAKCDYYFLTLAISCPYRQLKRCNNLARMCFFICNVE